METKSKKEFLAGPVVRTWCFHCGGPDSIPGQGTKSLQVARHDQNKQKESKPSFDDPTSTVPSSPWALGVAEGCFHRRPIREASRGTTSSLHPSPDPSPSALRLKGQDLHLQTGKVSGLSSKVRREGRKVSKCCCLYQSSSK